MDKQLYNELMQEIEQLAQMTQREFVSVREEMRSGFAGVREEIRNEVGLLRGDMEVGFQGINSTLLDIREDLRYQKNIIIDHGTRIDRIEKKIGIKASKNPRLNPVK